MAKKQAAAKKTEKQKTADQLGLPIPRALVEFVLLGPADDHRQLQDTPILGDVWQAYADNPAATQDLLITPHVEFTAGHVARAIVEGLTAVRKETPVKDPANIAHLQGIVAARLSFYELLRVIVPLTYWWDNRMVPQAVNLEYPPEKVRERVKEMLDSFLKMRSAAPIEHLTALDRYLVLAGLILWAEQQPAPDHSAARANDDQKSVIEMVEGALKDIKQIVEPLVRLFAKIESDWKKNGWVDKYFAPKDIPRGGQSPRGRYLVFQVSLNRRAGLAMDKSIPAVKADAARTLFSVSCKQITWAVVDSGIDGEHDAFQGEDGSRVTKTFDFTRIRKIVSRDAFDEAAAERRIEELIDQTVLKKNKAEAKRRMKQLADDADEERPLNWSLIEDFICLDKPAAPASVHGTHVAGIIGARPIKDEAGNVRNAGGMCHDIQLYDFRVLAKSLEDTEFAVIAALQYIRYVNERHNFITIHGANLSLSIPHNVRNFACGRTPLCNECERMVDSGVVIVAAAGNRGYQTFETKDGAFESYAAFSVTDPGNAESVITVGSTHRYWPHTYGVSFFSSRGPTGDGRLKPDLVAPGERITSPTRTGEWGIESGTSMAAPHVSGAAAMLLARYPELIGQPRRIKQILCDTATDLGRERSFQGRGMLDILRAFQSI